MQNVNVVPSTTEDFKLLPGLTGSILSQFEEPTPKGGTFATVNLTPLLTALIDQDAGEEGRCARKRS
eukprot:g42239.t1